MLNKKTIYNTKLGLYFNIWILTKGKKRTYSAVSYTLLATLQN